MQLKKSDLILFMVDVTSGIHELDTSVAYCSGRIDKKVMLVVNKVDNGERLMDATEFYNLGLGDYFPLSSMNGSGTGELLDASCKESARSDC